MRIDIHSHCIPRPAIDDARNGRGIDGIEIRADDGAERVTHPRLGMRYPLMAEFHDLDAKLRHMDRFRIDCSVLSIVPLWLSHWVEVDEAVAFCRRANDWLAEFVSASDRLLGMATVPLQAPEAAAAELRRAPRSSRYP
jgi:aminocarboxymuconate-semialdehyde decarboxylase